jgi:hypothetical protein
VLQGALEIPFFLALKRRRHPCVVFGARGLVGQSGRQVTARLRIVLLAKLDLGETRLGFLADFGRQLLKAGQPIESSEGVLVTAQVLQSAAQRQETIDEVERPAHDAASMQRLG